MAEPLPLQATVSSSDALNPFELEVLLFPEIEGQERLSEVQTDTYCVFLKNYADEICNELEKILDVKVNRCFNDYTTTCTVHTLEKLNSVWNQFCSDWETMANKIKIKMDSLNCCEQIGVESSVFLPKVCIDIQSYEMGLEALASVTDTSKPPAYPTHVHDGGTDVATASQNIPQVQGNDTNAQPLTASEATEKTPDSDRGKEISEQDEQHVFPTSSNANIVNNKKQIEREGSSIDIDSGAGSKQKQPKKDSDINKFSQLNNREKDEVKHIESKVQDQFHTRENRNRQGQVPTTVFNVCLPYRYTASQMWVYYRSRKSLYPSAVQMYQDKHIPELWQTKEFSIPATNRNDYIYFYKMVSKPGLFDISHIICDTNNNRNLRFGFVLLDIFHHPSINQSYSYNTDLFHGSWTYIQFYNSQRNQTDVKSKLTELSDSKILEHFKKFYNTHDHDIYILHDLEKLMNSKSQKLFLVYILVKCLPIYSSVHNYFPKCLAKDCCDVFHEADFSQFPSQSNEVLKDVAAFLCSTAFGVLNPFAVVKFFYKCLTVEDCSSLIEITTCQTQASNEIDDCFRVLIPELQNGEKKGTIICLLLLEKIKSFEMILSISETLNVESHIPCSFKDALKVQAIKCSKERARESVADCLVRTNNSIEQLKTLVCKLTHPELQTALSEKLENKVLEIIRERRCEWKSSEIESLHCILMQSFLFCGDRITNVYCELVRSSQTSTQNVFVSILKKTNLITVAVSKLCIDWLKKTVQSSGQRHTSEEKRLCEMYQTIDSLLDIKAIADDSNLLTALDQIVKSEVDKMDTKLLMQAAKHVEKIPKNGRELYNTNVQERVLKNVEKFQYENWNGHLEAAMGSSEIISIDHCGHYSYMEALLNKVPAFGIQDTSKSSQDAATVQDIIENITFWYKVCRCDGTYSDKIKQHRSAMNVAAIMQSVMHNIAAQTTNVHFSKQILDLLERLDRNEKIKLCKVIEMIDVTKLDTVLMQLQHIVTDVDYKLKCISDLLEWLMKYEGVDCINSSQLHIEGLDIQSKKFKDLSKSVLTGLEYELCDIEQTMCLQDQWYLSDAIQVKKVLYLNSFHQFLLHYFLTDTNFVKENLNDKDMGNDKVTNSKSSETINVTSKSVSSLIQLISKTYVPKYMDFLCENVFAESEIQLCDIQFLFLKCTRKIEIQHLSDTIDRPLPERTNDFIRYLQEYDDIVRKASDFVRLCEAFDLKTNEDESTLMCVIREIIDMDKQKDSLTAKMLWKLMTNFENLTKHIDIWDILHELSRSSSLIKFLRSVINEDLRNLINAVEEHSEQFVQESTVSDLIQMMSILKPVLSKEKHKKTNTLVEELLECFSSRKDDTLLMINNCSLNCNDLKSLYMNVANRGEVTKETVMKILNKGLVSFRIEHDTVVTYIHYKDSKITHNITDLTDLRSRTLLISNTERQDDSQTHKNKKDLENFVDICDLIVDLSMLFKNLHVLGHFAFQKYDYESTELEPSQRIQELTNLLTQMEEIQHSWQDELSKVQSNSKFYYMNYLHSKQICILSDYFASKKHENDALSILKYIKPTFGVEKTIDTTFESVPNLAKIRFQLEKLAAAINATINSVSDVYISFPEDEDFLKQVENVDAKVNQGEVYVAHINMKSTDTIPILLALYANTTKLYPLPSQVLFCDEHTSWEEIQLIINRCVFKPVEYKDNLFCIVGVEKLSYEIQYHLVQCLKDLENDGVGHRKDYFLAVLCRTVTHNHFLTSLSSNVHQAPSLGSHAMKICLQNACEHIYMITSDLPGQGKTEQVRKEAEELSCRVNTIHISGPISKEKLVHLVKGALPGDSHILHLDIGSVDHPNLLDNFLFELLVLKCATAGTTCVHLQNRYVAIELSNTISNTLSDSLNICSSFKRKHLTWQHFANFIVSQEPESSVQTVCQYLLARKLDTIAEKEIQVSGIDAKPLSSEECQKLLNDFFAKDGQLTFAVVEVFLEVLAYQLRKLSSSHYFKIASLTAMLGDEKSAKTVRNDMVNTLITVSKEFSCRSVRTCCDKQNSDLGLVKSSVKTQTDAMLSRVEGMIQWSESNHLLVLFQSQDNQTVSSLYRELSKVPADVKTLLENQTRKKLPDFGKFSQEDLQNMLEKLVCQCRDSEVRNRLIHLFESYALTPDNILKMVLVILRIRAGIPVILMGETGCGKTTLVKYLAVTCGVNLKLFAFHAGITEAMVMTIIHNWNDQANRNRNKEHWLFLDEINTCDHLGILKEVICHKSCGEKKLAPNVVVIAACNPYRLRDENEIFTAGLKSKIIADQFSKLVYRVHPLPEAMIDYIWDYGTLHKNDEESYIQRMMQIVSENEETRCIIAQMIAYSQEFIRETEKSVSSVSLRDVNRFKTLTVWFVDFFKARHTFSKDTGPKNCNSIWRAVLLSLSHCYEVRLKSEDKRKAYWDGLACMFPRKEYTPIQCRNIIKIEQMDILNRMIIPVGIAKNTALRENVFVLFVCIMNRIPVFLVGKPGCSKSLSVQLLKSSLRGADSDDRFFKTLPQLYVVSYQGSESSTSEGIIKVFEKAEKYQKHNETTNVLPVVLLDEVGLAEISHFNPLKVLHSLLESSTGEYPEVAVVGISNWALDAAKMNRAIHLSRPDLTNSELVDTAKSIRDGLDTKSHVPEDLLNDLAHAYFEYQKIQPFQNFHGLRDYYSLIKYICIKYPSQIEQQKIEYQKKCEEKLQVGIQRNFGGHKHTIDASMSYRYFKQNLDLKDEVVSTENLIKHNLSDKLARHLMVITHGDYSVGIIANLLQDCNRTYEVIFGSRFEEDLRGEYNYRILSKIILCMEQGIVLILKDLKGIYGSLYDMLNQNYTTVGMKKVCRIALGAHSNPMCVVHDDFRCIVMVDAHDVDYSDPPFLNRFEKQILSFEDILHEKQAVCLDPLTKWVENFSTIPEKPFKPDDAFLGFHKQTVSSLLHHVQNEDIDLSEEELLKYCKMLLLQTCPPDAILRLSVSEIAETEDIEDIQDQYFNKISHKNITEYINKENINQQLINQNNGEIMNHLQAKKSIILTRSNININLEQILNPVIKVHVERLSSFKSEKQMNQNIASFFRNECRLLVIQCTPSLDSNHMLLMKLQLEKHRENYYLCEKAEMKHVAIVIHLNRQDDHGQSGWQFDYTNNWKILTIDRLDQTELEIKTSLLGQSIHYLLAKKFVSVMDVIKQGLIESFSCLKYTVGGRTVSEIWEAVNMIKGSDSLLNFMMKTVIDLLTTETTTHKYDENNWQVQVASDAETVFQGYPLVEAWKLYIYNKVKDALVQIIWYLESTSSWYTFISISDESNSDWLRHLWTECFQRTSSGVLKKVEVDRAPESMEILQPPLALQFPFSQALVSQFIDVGELFLQEEGTEHFEHLSELEPSNRSFIIDKYSSMIEKHYHVHLGSLDHVDNGKDRLEIDIYNICSYYPDLNLTEQTRLKMCKLYLQANLQKVKNDDFMTKITIIILTWALQKQTVRNLLQLASICEKSIQEDIVNALENMVNDSNEEKGLDQNEYNFDNAQVIVETLCRKLLPTQSYLDKVKNADIWFNQTSKVLAFASKVSFSCPVLHFLRFCVDIYRLLPNSKQDRTASLISFCDTSMSIATYGVDQLNQNEINVELLDSLDALRFVKRNIHRLQIQGNTNQAQKIICLYFARCIDANSESGLLTTISDMLRKRSLPDDNLTYTGPILHRILFETNIAENITQYLDPEIEDKGDSFIHILVARIKKDDQHPVIGIVLDIIEQFVKSEIDPNENSCIYFENACTIMKNADCYSVKYLVAVAFYRIYLEWFSKFLTDNYGLILTEKRSFVQRLDNFLSSSTEKGAAVAVSDALLYVLKIMNTSSIRELKDKMINIDDVLSSVKTINWPSVDIMQGIGINGLALHAYYQVAKDQLKRSVIHDVIQKIESDPSVLQGVIAALLEKFYWIGFTRRFSDTEKSITFVEDTLSMIDNMIKPLPVLLKGVLGVEEFFHKSLNISNQWKYVDCAQASIILHVSTLLSEQLVQNNQENIFMNLLMVVRSEFDHQIRQQREETIITTVHCSCGNIIIVGNSQLNECFLCKATDLSPTQKKVIIEPSSYCAIYTVDILRQACLLGTQALGDHDDVQNEDDSYTAFQTLWNSIKDQLNISDKQLVSLLHSIVEDCKNCVEIRELLTHVKSVLLDCAKKAQEFKVKVVKANQSTSDISAVMEEADDKFVQLTKQHCMFTSRRKKHASIECLRNYVITASECNNQHTFLRLVASEIKNLELLNCLQPILKWYLLVQRYVHHKISRVDATKNTLNDIITNEPKFKKLREKTFKDFQKFWNKLRNSEIVRRIVKAELPEIFIGKPISECVVQDKDKDQHPIYLVFKFLCNIHNTFIEKVSSVALTGNKAINFFCKETGVVAVPCVILHTSQPRNTITLKWDEDLLHHSQNSALYGYGEWIQYDLYRIEKEMADMLLVGKCYLVLDDQFPMTVYQNELFHWCSHIFLDIKNKIEQVSLYDKISQRLKQSSAEPHGQQSFRALLNYLETVVALLHRTKGNSCEKISSYASRFGISHDGILSPTILHLLNTELTLAHVVATYELVEEEIAYISVESLGSQYSQPLDSIEYLIEAFVNKYDIAGPFLTAVRRFTVRFLSIEVKRAQTLDSMKDLMCAPSMWPSGVTSDGLLSDGNKLVDLFPPSLLAEHTRKLHDYLHEIVQIEDKQKELRRENLRINTNRKKKKTKPFVRS